MKALIIEDTDYKLESAIRVLKSYKIEDYTHFNNYSKAMNLVSENSLTDFDLIVLDLTFYQYRPSRLTSMTPVQGIGYLFLYYMIEYESKNNVIVFSSEDNYKEGWNNFLFPTFENFCKSFEGSRVHRSLSDLEEEFEEQKTRNRKINKELDFVIGHAHNEIELSELVKKFIKANN